MTKYGGADIGFLLVGGYSVHSYVTAVDENHEAILEETTVLGDTWETKALVNLRQFALSVSGFYDDVAGASNEALVGLSGASQVACMGFEGNTVGKKFIGFQGPVQTTYKRTATRGALHKVAADYRGSGQLEEGLVHWPLATVSGATADGTAVDNTASSALGGSAYFQVSALVLGGYTNLALKVLHSSDDISYPALATATVVTAAPAAERVTVAGTVNRYTKGQYTFTGAGAGQSASIFIGFKRN